MRPDLLRRVTAERAVRRHLAGTLCAAAAAGLLVLAQAELLAGLLSGRFPGTAAAALAAVAALRAFLVRVQGGCAARTATAVKSALRHRLLARLGDPGPARPAGHRTGELITLAGRGLDGLDPYLTGYLPVAAVVPLAVVARLLAADPASAVIVLVTLPLIPVFGALVGTHTKAVTERQWRTLSRLGGHFLDVVRGLPTLRAFNRAAHQAEVIRRMAGAHRSATMRALRVAFLSSLVLELCASLSLALVAVPIGLRLLGGTLDLATGLLVLLLAPEAYLPLRAAGARFHAAMEGIAAAEAAFAVLDEAAGERTARPEPRDTAPPRPAVRPRAAVRADRGPSGGAPEVRLDRVAPGGPPEIRLDRVTVRYPGRAEPALADVSLVIRAGERVALVGESGGGKSTLLHLILGLITPDRGRVLIDGAEAVDLDAWRERVAFVPQRPHLFAATVADNIRLGAPHADLAEVRRAADAASATEFIDALPGGFAALIGEHGAGLSAGERQRIALARAFCRPGASVLLLDEPTARLDVRSEAAVTEAVARLIGNRTAIIVAHRPAMLELADRVIRLERGRITADVARTPRRPMPALTGGAP
ncbi:thiol reductant ABC exporter subunit CydD [Thermobispora bispora]|uniref:thiol reductant ABC exporter subunit CydD n=1 Tax=Thermobispora bispora TaxID=2006 RepID=UPI0019806F72|nr:thiol reductant ABC exporter subunit CydD [Thermobispora bispora]QSI49648.1 thiol reductant ABC exporter subunit CydD [Thermobispora bispora]